MATFSVAVSQKFLSSVNNHDDEDEFGYAFIFNIHSYLLANAG